MAADLSSIPSTTPVSTKLYKELRGALKTVGPFKEEVKKTCVHLVRSSAFLGVHPRKEHLLITVKSDRPMQSKRVAKLDQTSKTRWHADIKIFAATEIDRELLQWIERSYELSD